MLANMAMVLKVYLIMGVSVFLIWIFQGDK